MLNKKILLMLIIFLVLPMVLSQLNVPVIISNPYYKQSKPATVPLPCTINGNYCSENATCKTTIINPYGVILVNNQYMTHNGAVFEINLTSNQTDINGEYQFNVVCSDNGNSMSRNLKFNVNPSGEAPDTGKGIIYIGLIVLLFILFIVLIIGGIQSEYIPIKAGLFLFAYLVFLGICFIAWNLSLDYLTSSPFLISIFKIIFYFLMYALFPILLFTIIYTLYMMFKIKAIQKMIDRGVPEDEAYEREVKGGLKNLFR